MFFCCTRSWMPFALFQIIEFDFCCVLTTHISVWLTTCISVWLTTCISVWLTTHISVWLTTHISVWLTTCISVWLTTRISVWLTTCISVWLVTTLLILHCAKDQCLHHLLIIIYSPINQHCASPSRGNLHGQIKLAQSRN